MMSMNKHHLPDETREQILAAARERFLIYGYNKTTMAEIAKDCDMSAANLYRYFENKLDIGANLACNCLNTKEQILANVLSKPGLSASEKLQHYVLETLKETHTRTSETPKINEMVMAICQSQMDIVNQHMTTKRELLTTLIEKGNSLGEFDVPNPNEASQSILIAITVFDVPTFMSMYTLDEMETMAKRLVDLLLSGLRKK